jgi:hypothetical protein
MKCIIASALLSALISVPAFAASGTATFDSYAENIYLGPLHDVPSGITFNTFQDGNGSQYYAMEFVGPHPSTPIFSSTTYLTGDGGAPGPGAALNGDFGFNATLPVLAGLVSLDVFYSEFPPPSPGSVTLTAFDSAGNALGSTTNTPVSGDFVESSIFLALPGNTIHSISVRANGLFTGYDNVHFETVPEPASLLWMAMGLCALRRRR